MPYYFTSMLEAYFRLPINEINMDLVDENLFYDYIDAIVYEFGPPSFSDTTPQSVKMDFNIWKSEIYSIVTKEVSIENISEIGRQKYTIFWDNVEERNLSYSMLNKEIITDVFNYSPVKMLILGGINV